MKNIKLLFTNKFSESFLLLRTVLAYNIIKFVASCSLHFLNIFDKVLRKLTFCGLKIVKFERAYLQAGRFIRFTMSWFHIIWATYLTR